MRDGNAMHDAFNAVDDFMKVNCGQLEKVVVFEQYKQKYLDHFSQLEALEKQRQEIAQIIGANSQNFSQVLSMVG